MFCIRRGTKKGASRIISRVAPSRVVRSGCEPHQTNLCEREALMQLHVGSADLDDWPSVDFTLGRANSCELTCSVQPDAQARSNGMQSTAFSSNRRSFVEIGAGLRQSSVHTLESRMGLARGHRVPWPRHAARLPDTRTKRRSQKPINPRRPSVFSRATRGLEREGESPARAWPYHPCSPL